MAREILITGAHGALGTALQLYAAGGDRRLHTPTATELDVTQIDAGREYLKDRKVRAIVHLAAITDWEMAHKDPRRAADVNTLGAANLALLAKEQGAFLVIASTDAVLAGTPKNGGFTETDLPSGPTNFYGWTKWASELAPRMADLPSQQYLIARCGWFFGPTPTQDRKFVGAILRRLANGAAKIEAVGDKTGTMAYTSHIAQKLFTYIDQQTSGIRHLANTGAVTRYEVARKIVELWGRGGVTVAEVTSDRFPSEVRRPDYAVLTTIFADARLPHWEQALVEYRNRYPDVAAFR